MQIGSSLNLVSSTMSVWKRKAKASFNSFVCIHSKVLSYFLSLLAVFPFVLLTTEARERQISWKGKVWNNCNNYFLKKSLWPTIPTFILFQWPSISRVFWKIICFCCEDNHMKFPFCEKLNSFYLKNVHSIFVFVGDDKSSRLCHI